jgi:hypothetical protein
MLRSTTALALAALMCPAPAAGAQTTTPAPQRAPLDPKSEEIRRKVEKIGVGGRITVIRHDGIEHYGTVRKIDATTFEVAEVDIKQPVVDAYADVKKVRHGYGGFNPISGKRPNPLWGWVAGAAIFVPLIIAVAHAKD